MGQVAFGCQGDTVIAQARRRCYGIPDVQLELELGRKMQNRKGFPKYTGNKRNAQNSIHSLPLNSYITTEGNQIIQAYCVLDKSSLILCVTGNGF